MSNTGTNVWYDLMTPNPQEAIAFYSETIGWKTEPFEGAPADQPYTMWKLGDNTIGGVMALPEDAKAMGAPPHWIAYTTVDDVDATQQKAESLGGKTFQQPFDIPNVGRIAVLADPQGAAFAIYKPAGDMPDRQRNTAGDIGWAELNTTDYEGAWKFYSELFGWKHSSSMDMGDGNTYFMFENDSKSTRGGMSNAAAQLNFPPSWLHYINVDKIDEAIGRITQKGGKVTMGPMDIPGGDKVAVCVDPQGAAFALYSEGGN